MKIFSLFILTALISSTAALAGTKRVYCHCYVDYGLSFENLGTVEFRATADEIESGSYENRGDELCRKTYNRRGAHTLGCGLIE